MSIEMVIDDSSSDKLITFRRLIKGSAEKDSDSTHNFSNRGVTKTNCIEP